MSDLVFWWGCFCYFMGVYLFLILYDLLIMLDGFSYNNELILLMCMV